MSGTKEMSEMNVVVWEKGSLKFCITGKNRCVSSLLLAGPSSGSECTW